MRMGMATLFNYNLHNIYIIQADDRNENKSGDKIPGTARFLTYASLLKGM